MSTLIFACDGVLADTEGNAVERAAELSGRKYGRHAKGDPGYDDDVRMRVIADHVRSALMLIGDGVAPSNEARGYVVRRLLRRSVRAMRLLGVDEPTLPELLPVSKDAMKAAYPELELEFDPTDEDLQRRADLDETRRLCYAALSATPADGASPLLSATIVNALVHHQGVNPQEALEHVPRVLRGANVPVASRRWVEKQIDRITAELGDAPAEVNRGAEL